MNLFGLELGLFGAPLAAGLLVVATHVPLGQQVLRRGIIFIDLAIAQIAALGVVLGQLLGLATHSWMLQATAVGAALLGAWALQATDRRWPRLQEAIIGVAFVLAASAAVLLLSQDPHGTERFKELLVGQILWLTWAEVGPVALVYALLLVVLWRLPRWRAAGRRDLGFYLLFALCVTLSMQLVGVYLVFASLILPALASGSITDRRTLLRGYSVGGLGYVIGFLISAQFDLPTSAVIVWCLALVALTSLLTRRSRT